MLVRCLYASRAADPRDAGLLEGILRQSRRNNPRLGVTGMLFYANGVFAQVLEGGRGEVSQLLGAIFRDARHTGAQILVFEEIIERRFESWTMGQVTHTNPALLLKYSQSAELNPFAATGAATMAMMVELASSGSIVCRAG